VLLVNVLINVNKMNVLIQILKFALNVEKIEPTSLIVTAIRGIMKIFNLNNAIHVLKVVFNVKVLIRVIIAI
jgi:hypothetical protein